MARGWSAVLGRASAFGAAPSRVRRFSGRSRDVKVFTNLDFNITSSRDGTQSGDTQFIRDSKDKRNKLQTAFTKEIKETAAKSMVWWVGRGKGLELVCCAFGFRLTLGGGGVIL